MTQDDVKAAEATLKIAETKPTSLSTTSSTTDATAASDSGKVSAAGDQDKTNSAAGSEEPRRRTYQRVSCHPCH